MLKFRGILLSVLLLFVASAAQAAGLPPIFGEAVVREIMLTSKPGVRILTEVTAVNVEYTTEATLRSFMQRLEWQQNSALRERLAEEFTSIERSFGEYRTSKGKNPKLEAGEMLTKEERLFLASLAERSLANSAVDNLLLQSRRFFEIPKSRADLVQQKDRFLRGESTPQTLGSEVPQLPSQIEDLAGPNADLPDLSILEQGFRSKLAERFRLYQKFFQTFSLSDAEVRRLFGLAGKTFTETDLVLVRKLNRLLDVLNEYSRMRLVIKAFAQERPALYERLNAETADSTRQYLDGILSEADYLAARKAAAEKLRINGIVAEAERRMLSIVTRCKELGGGAFAGVKNRASIDISEANLLKTQEMFKKQTAVLEKLDLKKLQLESDRAATTSATHRSEMEAQLREIRRTLLREHAELELWRQREVTEAENLKKMYIDFVEAYDSLTIFVNLRNGRVNSEEVRAFDLPDAFVPSASEMQVWKEYYDRAIYNSTHELVVRESKAFFSAQAGATRQFVRSMNEMTGKYFGKRFTESELGQEFVEYNRSVARVAIERVAKFLGISLPTAGVGTYWADKLWSYMFTDKLEGEGNGSSPDPTETPATGGVPGGSQGGTQGAEPSTSPGGVVPASGGRRSTIPRPAPIRLEDPKTAVQPH